MTALWLATVVAPGYIWLVLMIAALCDDGGSVAVDDAEWSEFCDWVRRGSV